MSSILLLVTDGLDGQAGGVQRVTRSVVRAAMGLGDEVRVWSANDRDGGFCSREAGGVRTLCFNRRYFDMGLAALLGRDLPFDCRRVDCWHLALSPIARVLSARLRCPYRVFFHGVEAWGGFSWIQNWGMRGAAGFAANSRYTWERFRSVHPDLAGIPADVIPLGLNEEFERTVAPFAGREGRPYLLTVTRLAETYKGMETLLRAFLTVSREWPEIELVCVGEGPRRAEWEEMAASLGLAERVWFAGRVPDAELAAFYAGCRAFALLSEEEGFGIVYLEAMFHGKPCLASGAGAAREIVRDGETGLVVPPRDAGAAAAALRRLLDGSGERERLGEAARRMVLADYTATEFEGRLRKFLGQAED
ncbi:MAG: glycosyltransferase family 4 protein [Verrucomicrobiae bacterium]|nr:glycosyltransferase family 4 protein [Verrucomicrobiae bacterium]